jgi:hypothetical protein
MIFQGSEFVNTKQLAILLGGIKPETIHRGLCKRGMYLGLRPKKLKNGRLLWDVEEVKSKVFNNL